MLRLMLLRHAKSAWDDPGLADHERSLNARGRDAAPRMAAYMRAEGLVPDRAVVSSSRRTRETWALLSAELPFVPSVVIEERIYEASPDALLAVVRETPDEARRLLVVGHNPGLQLLALILARRDMTEARRSLTKKFPTAALAVLDFHAAQGWSEIFPDTGVIERFVTPKAIGAADADD